MSDFLFLLTFFMTVITKCDSSSFCCYNMLTRTSSMISATHAFGEATWFTSNKYVLAGFAVNVLTECSRGLFPGGHFLWRVLALSSSDRFFIVRREDRRVRAFEDFLLWWRRYIFFLNIFNFLRCNVLHVSKRTWFFGHNCRIGDLFTLYIGSRRGLPAILRRWRVTHLSWLLVSLTNWRYLRCRRRVFQWRSHCVWTIIADVPEALT